MTGPPIPPRNPLDDLVGYQLRRASAAAMGELSRDLAAVGLTPTEASILLLIEANPGIRQSELGRILGIQRANMTPLTAALDKHGLIRRKRVDGRSHGLAVTARGSDLAVASRRTMDSHDARLLARLPEPMRAVLLAALAAMGSS